MAKEIKEPVKYTCTSCGGDAYIAFVPETIKRGKLKGQQRAGWNGIVKPGERICLPCGKKRQLKIL